MKLDDLLLEAKIALENAYAPYSNINVGTAILTKDDQIVYGCNVENKSISVRICAERNALFSAKAMGYGSIKAIAVIANTKKPVIPCNYCRLVMKELCDKETPVILGNLKGESIKTKVGELNISKDFNPNSLRALVNERRQ